ncbi:DEAD_2 domain protein [Alkaliphilus metalliredigens QYMF]|uniref:DEAD_2 domain protein n=1 Tax=Alkaliphilus metalliredigens (strain QYMF) TaxID=293826 RepID=A6TVT2_ALKMQ|nr:ATP-dependent DNA helicase [Alkaliphilus metalliredigens]ABR50300.1 DEAD_2 domain protein [Alkaliphilus metalliredigens QYMF]
MEEQREIKVSVGNLVEFVLRSGNLDSGFSGGSSAIEGTRAHQKIQKNYGENDTSEITLKYSFDYQEHKMTVKGRADGIILEDEKVIIDEIKTVTKSLDEIEENDYPIHWGQAQCYAYIYAKENNLEAIGVQLTYYQLETQEIKRFRRTITICELEAFFYDLIKQYFQWAHRIEKWEMKRDLSIKDMKFPFEAYRKGQRELAVATYKTIRGKKKLFAQAPTGTGKTISTLFPGVKAMGEGMTSKIFYLTAKTITRQVAEEAIVKIREKGLAYKTITLTAKDKICFEKVGSCNTDECRFAKGHFDRLNEALSDVFDHEDAFTRDVMETYARKHHICPFEFSLELALWSDCIICDYNYVFDPRVYLKRFFQEEGKNYTFLIDEAHNLVDRSRTMFSAELNKGTFLELKRVMKDKSPKVAKTLNKLNSFMIKAKKNCGENEFYIQKEAPLEMDQLLRHFISEAAIWLKEGRGKGGYEALLELYFSAFAFLRILEFYDDRYTTYVEKRDKDVVIKLFCLDPSYLLGQAVRRGGAAIFFSATLTPLNYFRDILGGHEEDYQIQLSSPFDKENLKLMVANDISTKYKDRQESYEPIIKYIKEVVRGKEGNYLVFFPSYEYLRRVLELFREACPDIKVLEQGTTMTEPEREGFLRQFKSKPSETLIGFVVLGGIFSEGIDLTGNRLIGTIIIGVGLPQITRETDIVMNYFQEKKRPGYEYAYTYPGMNKVLQAAGRVIRREKDRGVVFLIDERFTSYRYQRLFPKEWKHYLTISNRSTIDTLLEAFWSE